jgi:dynein heavy chain
LPTADDLVKCWAHECLRVFEDRLLTEEDRQLVLKAVKHEMKETYQREWDIVVTLEPLLFGNFLSTRETTYQEISDLTDLEERASAACFEYAQTKKNAPALNLVLFPYALHHIVRIVRVLRLPQASLLLVGPGGTGRKSLATLASFMANAELMQIENPSRSYSLSEWNEDLKRTVLAAGGNGAQTAMLLLSSQLILERCWDDLSQILHGHPVPNLLGAEERSQVLEMCTKPARAAGKIKQQEIYDFFQDQCRRYLHIIVCISPGEPLRALLQNYPAFQLCAVDVCANWPEDAYRATATQILAQGGCSRILGEQVTSSVSDVCVHLHGHAKDLAGQNASPSQVAVHVNPAVFLELLKLFLAFYTKFRDELSEQKMRFDAGLDQLRKTSAFVGEMQEDLDKLTPVLASTSTEHEELKVLLEGKKVEADQFRAKAKEHEDICAGHAEKVTRLKEECQADVDKALPALEASLDAIKDIEKKELKALKEMKTPPESILAVSKALCLLLDVQPKKVKSQDGKSKTDDYWESAKKSVWGSSSLLDQLLTFDKDSIPVDTVVQLNAIVGTDVFEEDKMREHSAAAGHISKWVRAMLLYDAVAKVVEPKKKELAAAEAIYAEAMEEKSVADESFEATTVELEHYKKETAEKERYKQELTNFNKTMGVLK